MQNLKDSFIPFPKRDEELEDPHLNVTYQDIRRSTGKQRSYIYGLLSSTGLTKQDALNLIHSDKEDIRLLEQKEAAELIDVLKFIKQEDEENEYW